MHIRTPIASYIIRTKTHTGRCNARKKEKKSNTDAIDRRDAADLAFTDIENVKISRGRNIFLGLVSQNVLKQAANWLLPGTYICKRGAERHIDGKN